jgi:pimeloyl-ACP methyl ester carboxylesterase
MMTNVDGRAVKVYEGGHPTPAGSAPHGVVVFLHGAQNDHSVWILQSRYLAHHGWRVLAVDLPGHGGSEGPPLADVDSAASWVIRLLDACGEPRAALCGHSMGSLIALAAGALAPERIAGVALVGTAQPMPVSDALLEAAEHDEPRAIEMILGWSNFGLSHPPGHPGPGFSIYHQNRRLMQRQAPGILLNDLRACHEWEGGEAAARALRVPALIVSGANDLMTPPRAADGLAAILSDPAGNCPSLVRRTLGDCGHNLMAEQPAAVRDALRDWLVTLKTPASV